MDSGTGRVGTSHFPALTCLVTMTTIAIIGAGYAGLLAANRATERGHRVTLINERETFIDRIRLHEYIAGSRPPHRTTRPLRSMVRVQVRVCVDRATAYETGAVTLQSGEILTAEHILITTGSSAASGGWEWAIQSRNQVEALTGDATVAVLGAGLTGIEVASEIATTRPELKVVLVDPRTPGWDMSSRARHSLHRSLDRLTVEVRTTAPASSDITIDCTGFERDSLTGGAVIDVDEFLRVPGRERVWGAGDAVRVARQPHLRMACATAEPLAAHAIDQIERHVRATDMRPVSLGYAGRCLSLGRRDGLIQFVHRDDSPSGRIWTGRPAALAKESLCRFAVMAPVRLARWYRELNGPTYA